MPNRIIKESICTSETIDKLSWFEEVFFERLLVNCDDYGRFDARPAILKARLFPLKSITDKQLNEALNKLQTVGIVILYESDKRPYLQFATWENHQQIRSRKSKFPAPVSYAKSSDIICNQIISDAPVIQSNPIQSEYESNPNTNIGDESPPTSEEKPIKQKYGEFANVLLTEEEHKRLQDDFGDDADLLIQILSDYIHQNPKYKKPDHNRVLRGWVKNRLRDDRIEEAERQQREQRLNGGREAKDGFKPNTQNSSGYELKTTKL